MVRPNDSIDNVKDQAEREDESIHDAASQTSGGEQRFDGGQEARHCEQNIAKYKGIIDNRIAGIKHSKRQVR